MFLQRLKALVRSPDQARDAPQPVSLNTRPRKRLRFGPSPVSSPIKSGPTTPTPLAGPEQLPPEVAATPSPGQPPALAPAADWSDLRTRHSDRERQDRRPEGGFERLTVIKAMINAAQRQIADIEDAISGGLVEPSDIHAQISALERSLRGASERPGADQHRGAMQPMDLDSVRPVLREDTQPLGTRSVEDRVPTPAPTSRGYTGTRSIRSGRSDPRSRGPETRSIRSEERTARSDGRSAPLTASGGLAIRRPQLTPQTEAEKARELRQKQDLKSSVVLRNVPEAHIETTAGLIEWIQSKLAEEGRACTVVSAEAGVKILGRRTSNGNRVMTVMIKLPETVDLPSLLRDLRSALNASGIYVSKAMTTYQMRRHQAQMQYRREQQAGGQLVSFRSGPRGRRMVVNGQDVTLTELEQAFERLMDKSRRHE